MNTIFAGLRLADTHSDLYRNIVSLRVTENLFDDLSENPSDWQQAIELEVQTQPATYISKTPIIHRPFEEAAWNEAIGFPFREWSRSRYSDGSFGVWYGSDTLETTIYETVHYWRNSLLADAGFAAPGIIIERRVHLVRCDAALIDLRDMVAQHPMLVSPNDYTVTQQVGARLHKEGHPGLVTASARCVGDVYAVFNPAVLSNPRPNCYLTYTTTDDGVDVERTPGESLLSIPG
ncbi:MAG: RES family NAD+ phosphorylase [Gallionellaceae bacterium]|nr:RES family NAD+ phosphorylase [Gallionellaceae bacterium]